jgi:hypothetical protein
MAKGWTYTNAMLALVKRGEETTELSNKGVFINLFPQQPKCAQMRTPDSGKVEEYGHIKINPKQKLQIDEKFKFDLGFLKEAAAGKDGWEYYTVTDWDKFADALGLAWVDSQ